MQEEELQARLWDVVRPFGINMMRGLWDTLGPSWDCGNDESPKIQNLVERFNVCSSLDQGLNNLV